MAGVVELTVAAIAEPPANVVFYFGHEPFAKAYVDEAGPFSAIWDATSVTPGRYTLSAKPYGGTTIDTSVTVAPRRASE